MAATFDLQPRFSALKRKRADAISESSSQFIVDLEGPWAIVDSQSHGWFPSQNLNRVIDVHTSTEEFDEVAKRMIAVYEDAGVPRHFVYLDPSSRSADLFRSLSDAGYRVCNEMSVLVKIMTEIRMEPGRFSVQTVGESASRDIERVLSYHGTQEVMWREPTAGLIGKPGCEVFLAYEGDVPVAVGAVTCHEGIAYLSNATTVPEWRGRGAHTELIDARLRWAADQGCDHAFVETYRFLESSYSNLVRCGFRELYQRWICRFETDALRRSTLLHTLDGHELPEAGK